MHKKDIVTQQGRTLKFYLKCVLVLVTPFFFWIDHAKKSLADDGLSTYAIALHGSPKLPADYRHFSYVNPDAPKGGTVRYGAFGNFNSLNPFILKGEAVRGVWDHEVGVNNVFESLLYRNRDEPFSLYGLLANKAITNDERSFIEFHINPEARFADGTPVTVDDVLFSMELLGKVGRPNYGNIWRKVASSEKTGENGIRFVFNKQADRETPLLLGMMPIFPAHAIKPDEFSRTGLKPMIGSGPYEIADVIAGSSITFARRKDYWGENLPARRGFDNFDIIKFEYFQDRNALFNAFKKGIIDVYFSTYSESDPQQWKRAFNFPAVTRGDIVKIEIERKNPANMQGFIFNTRREKFKNKKVRMALTLLFDFEWLNRNIFDNAYKRTQSFWQRSFLSSFNLPASEAELALLKPYMEDINPEILSGTYRLPVSDGSGSDRRILQKALGLFREAGYSLKEGKLIDSSDNPFEFELLIDNSRMLERIALSWKKNLEHLGISMSIKTADYTQLERRKIKFDFDMTYMVYTASFSPGAEQINRWGSSSRDIEGSFNLAGANNPAIDAVMEEMMRARSMEKFHTAIRAYDRLLINGNYIIPFYYLDKQWVAMRKNIRFPAFTPIYGIQYSAWWDDNAVQKE